MDPFKRRRELMADDLLKFYSVTGDCALFQLSAGHVPTIKVKIRPCLEIEGVLCARERGDIEDFSRLCLFGSCDTLVPGLRNIYVHIDRSRLES